MASLITERDVDSSGPLDLIEKIVASHEWPYDRPSDEELTVFVAGNWSEYSLHFAWNGGAAPDFGGLQLVCAFDGRLPEGAKGPVYELLAKINAQMWIGHFDMVEEENLLMYRHGVLLPEAKGATPIECESLIEIALSECERYFPAFQFVLWGGKTADEAIAAAMFDTIGEA